MSVSVLPSDNAAPPAAYSQLHDRYFNRELSWLAFNARVLAEARLETYPLLERLRFLSISGSNLDEFMMIRVAGLAAQVRRGVDNRSIDGKSPTQQLAAIKQVTADLSEAQQEVLRDLLPLLAQEGIHIKAEDRINAEAESWLESYFRHQLMPVITPQAVDPAHPFPFVSNGGVGALFTLTRLEDNHPLVEMVLVPSIIPRFVRIPGKEAIYIPVEQVICRYAHLLFPGFRVEGDGVFRLLRDSDIEVQEEAEDLVRFFRTAIQRRRRGRVIAMELDDQCDPMAETMLREQVGMDQASITKTSGLIGIAALAQIVEKDRPDLKFRPYTPRYPERVLEHDGDCFAAIRAKDLVIHHPYENFEVVIDFLHQAARDPAVVAIKQTLYRAGNQSPVIAALVKAAENGKSVTAVVELKARFDEEQNLKWASELERAGVQVIYGFVDWKTHAKVSMVVRQEEDGYRTYCHFGTGNYHPVTAKIYTDLSFFTADPEFGRDAMRLFNFVTGYIKPPELEALALSPLNLRQSLMDLIDQEMAHARAGKTAEIWAKMNSLTEQGLIDKLYEASQAGVRIVLVVRGICCLRPGLPGLSDSISVKSIIGRFLEHSRIWAFANGHALPSPHAKVFISSADGMSRNLSRRVETLVPIRNATVHDQVLDQVLLANLLDTEQSWLLDGSDGEWERVEVEGENGFNCHKYFMTNPSLSGRGEAMADSRVPTLTLRKAAV